MNYTAIRASSERTCAPNLTWRTILVSATFAALLFLASCANKTTSGQHATILMRDGTTLTGIVTATSPAEIILAGDDNGTHTVPMTQVKSIEYDEVPAAQSSATQTSDANSGAPATTTRRSAASRADDAAHEHHYHPTQAEIHTKTYVLPVDAKVPVRTEETIDSATAAEGQTYAAEIADDVFDANGDVVVPVVQTLRSSFDRLRRETVFTAPPTLCWICNRFRLEASST